MSYQSTKVLELGSCAFRQWRADHSHCHFIHGYRLIAKFWFGCSELDNKNWVVDFGGLKELKRELEKQFDHTFCVAADDPLLEKFKDLHNAGACDLRIMEKGVGIERTAEWCFNKASEVVSRLTNNRCWVEKVEVWEHEKNSAIYTYTQKSSPFWNDVVNVKTETTPESKFNAKQFEFNFNQPVATSVAAPAPEVTEAVNKAEQKIPARVGGNVTPGFSNLFGGTSWGK